MKKIKMKNTNRKSLICLLLLTVLLVFSSCVEATVHEDESKDNIIQSDKDTDTLDVKENSNPQDTSDTKETVKPQDTSNPQNNVPEVEEPRRWFDSLLEMSYPSKEEDKYKVTYLIVDDVAISSKYVERTTPTDIGSKYYTGYVLKDGGNTNLYRLVDKTIYATDVPVDLVRYVEKLFGYEINTYMIDGRVPQCIPLEAPNNIKNYGINNDEATMKYTVVDGVLYNKEKTILIAFPAGREGEFAVPDTVVTIANNAFDQSKLSKVTLPSSVTEVGTAFDRAPGLTVVRS